MTWEYIGRPLRVAVLGGGDSPEREVSLASGEQVLAALAAGGHDGQGFDPAETPLDSIPWHQFDVCFIALHGGAGEDGRVQSDLERLNVPYTGSGPTASRLAMSKSASKERWRQAGISTLSYALLEAAESSFPGSAWERIAAKALPSLPGQTRGTTARQSRGDSVFPGGAWEQGLNLPLVVKPDSQGSSLGVSLVREPEELPTALEAAFAFDPFVVAEQWIEGREFTVALLGLRALPLLEIVAAEPIFSFAAKYSTGQTQLTFEHGLPATQEAAIREAAVAAAAALGTRSLARVDLMLDRVGRPWVLEVNTVPGLTAHSLAPRAAARAGFDLPSLCGWMLREALALEAVA